MTDAATPPNGPLPTVELGRTGKRATRLGLGGFHQIEVSSEIVAEVIDAYLSAGGNYVETARDYGRGASEQKIGRALQGRRAQVILCSKTSAATADQAKGDLELTLAALGTDRLDFYFFHCVGPDKLDQITAKGGAAEALLQMKDQGVIDGLGFSSHVPPVYLDAFERIDLSVILIWFNYLDNLNFPIIPDRVVPEASRRGIAVTGMKPLADGFLHRSVEDAIAYSLGAGAELAVCGANSVQQVRQAVAAVNKGPADDAARQDILARAVELGRYVCRRCGRCDEALTELFRLEGEFDRQMIDFLPHGAAEYALRKNLSHWFHQDEAAKGKYASAGLDTEQLIAAAEPVQCPYHIDVARKARIAAAKLTGARPELL